ncbi:MAG TPA: lysylphosphatidylglycerol synthase transmembrane domain-containing protein [Candidatus Saccharimonadales bacterium]|nr:lysylphosphatidylglycerol synthase transmembrane domain-containing protein [Candidatus Saccharimonadales bacterium]
MGHVPFYQLSKKFVNHTWVYIIGLILLGYIIFARHNVIGLTINAIVAAKLQWIIASLLLVFCSQIAATLKYISLSLKHLKFMPTLLVQLTSMLTSRLLPAGLGGVGVNYVYLRRCRHTNGEAVAVVGTNSFLGFVGHVIIVTSLVLTIHGSWDGIIPQIHWSHWYSVSLIVIFIGVVFAISNFRHQIHKSIGQITHYLALYKHQFNKVITAIFYTIIITLLYATALFCCARALNVFLPLVTALIVLSVGIAAATVTPSPGGLIGAEAGLTAALVAYGIGASRAIAVTVLYRLVTFWFSLLIGAISLIGVERKKII